MKRTSLIISILLFITVFNFGRAVSGQTTPTDSDQYSAPIVWTEYRIPSQKLSITFPKLPVFTNASNLCSQIEGGLYVAYAGGAVYEFEWHTKSHAAIPDLCSVKTKFSKTTFTDRISELKAQVFGYVESEGAIAGIPATVLRSTSATGSVVRSRWLIWNKDRWLEFGITRRKETVIDEVRFLSGLKLSSSTGQDVKSGATTTLGDSDVDLKSVFEGKNSEGLIVVAKPRAAYTEAARQATIQGTVILRITFLRNGAVGSTSVVKGLGLGLTEQSIIAARRISFLPGTVDGKPINVTKQVEYTFGIY